MGWRDRGPSSRRRFAACIRTIAQSPVNCLQDDPPYLAVQKRIPVMARVRTPASPAFGTAGRAKPAPPEARTAPGYAPAPGHRRGSGLPAVENFGALDSFHWHSGKDDPPSCGRLHRQASRLFGGDTVALPAAAITPGPFGVVRLALGGIRAKRPPNIRGPPRPGLTSFATSGEPHAFLHARVLP